MTRASPAIVSTPAVDLESTARMLVQPAKGILAADETPATIGKRFDALGIPSTPETRRAYRELLISSPGLSDVLNGVILQDETIRQSLSTGTPFAEAVRERGMIPGIKVDKGAKPLAGAPGETVTEGLDGLRERIAEYVQLGARFSKWRAVISIGDGIPTQRAIVANAHALARYAGLSQEGGLVPIVEPEVLIDGDHSIGQCFDATVAMLRELFQQLAEQAVVLEALVLKTSMVLSGKASKEQAPVERVAEMTVRCLRQTVPAAVPGVAFLSGGQSPKLAVRHLDAINRQGQQPWQLTFSYARGLQDPALAAWKGQAGQLAAAQAAFIRQARLVAAARSGSYSDDMD
ncbi:MAG TPA: class I fructose-bisphosphate aldolase [Candidatus Acidoferrum sp.]|nr:class I fructose-bisphosphate aldolase [Candidatus Acidoferrum sp.]